MTRVEALRLKSALVVINAMPISASLPTDVKCEVGRLIRYGLVKEVPTHGDLNHICLTETGQIALA